MWVWSRWVVTGAFMGGPEPGRRVHPLIHILLLDIDVAIDMDDADIAVDMRRDAAHIGKAEAVVAAADDGEHARVKICDTAFVTWSKVFSILPGMTKMSPASQRSSSS